MRQDLNPRSTLLIDWADCRWCCTSGFTRIWSSTCTVPNLQLRFRGMSIGTTKWELFLFLHSCGRRDYMSSKSYSCVTVRRMVRLMGDVSSTYCRCYTDQGFPFPAVAHQWLWDVREWMKREVTVIRLDLGVENTQRSTKTHRDLEANNIWRHKCENITK